MNRFRVLTILLSLLTIGGCGQPVLESGECVEARNVIKQFYSAYLGKQPDQLSELARFLDKELLAEIESSGENKVDYFTKSVENIAAFRAGSCESSSPDAVSMEVLVFWRTETGASEEPVLVKAKKVSGSWVIEKVEPGK